MTKYLLSASLLAFTLAAGATDYTQRTANIASATTAPVSHQAKTTKSDKVMVAKAEAINHDWVSIGQCAFTDDMLSGPYSTLQPYTMTVEVEADKNNPGYYRMVDVYGDQNPYIEALTDLRVNDDALRYVVINATDENNVIIEPSLIGLKYPGNDEEYLVASQSWYETTGEVPSSFIDSYGLRGKIVNNIITFGLGAIWVSTPTLDAQGSGWTSCRNGGFKLVLPGGADYSTEIGTNSWCPDDYNRVVVAVLCGNDVAEARLQATRAGAPEPTDADFAVAQSLEPNKGFYFTLLNDSKPNERYTLYARSYDSEGKQVGDAITYVYATDFTQWTKMGATAKVTENILSNVYSDIDMGEYEVEVEADPATPGRYRLVDPYVNAPYNMSTIDTHGAHSHYIYLDCTDPDCVILEESPVGMMTLTDGAMRVTSEAALMLQEGKTKKEIKDAAAGGIMKYNVISFPVTASIYVGYNTEGTKLWYANYDVDSYGNQVAGKLKIDLRDAIASVNSVIADTAENTEYFTLQGIRVDAPAEGLYIVRRGGKVTKEYIR